MKKMLKLLKKKVIKALIHFHGLTFYETHLTPKSNCYKKLEVKTVYGHDIHFFFYEEELNDIKYRFGRFSHSKSKVCLLQANFDDSMPLPITKYNNLKIMVDTNSFLFKDDDLLAEVLLSAYLDFILDKEHFPNTN